MSTSVYTRLTRLISFENNFADLRSESRCALKKVLEVMSMSVYTRLTRLISFAKHFADLRSESRCALKNVLEVMSTSVYTRLTRLILFANTFCTFTCEMFLMRSVIAVFNSLSMLRCCQLNLRTVA
jgi:uncharacterized membrane protein (DUF485 family)